MMAMLNSRRWLLRRLPPLTLLATALSSAGTLSASSQDEDDSPPEPSPCSLSNPPRALSLSSSKPRPGWAFLLASVLLHEAVHQMQHDRGDLYQGKAAEYAAHTAQEVFLHVVGMQHRSVYLRWIDP